MYQNNGFTQMVQYALQNAGELATQSGQNLLGTEHLLFGIISMDECLSSKLLEKYGVNQHTFLQIFDEKFKKTPSLNAKQIELSPRVKEVLKNAKGIANTLGHDFIGTEHITYALLSSSENTAISILSDGFKINIVSLRDDLLQVLKDGAAATIPEDDVVINLERDEQQNSALPKKLLTLGVDLTQKAREHKIDPIIGREDEIERVIEILCRKTKNNPVLIGEAGVGKSAVVEGLAHAIVSGKVPEFLRDKIIFSLDIGSLMAGTKYRGSMEERLKDTIETIIKCKNIIVFIDELHTLAQAGAEKGEVNPSDMLKPYLARGELQTVGATTTDEYRKFIEKDKALERRFQPVVVNPPTVAQTIEILKGIRDSYEAFHKVKITDEAIEAAATLSDRYIMDRSLPDKAIDLVDEAASRAKVKGMTMPTPLKDKQEELVILEQSKKEAIIAQNFEKAASIRDKISKISEEIEQIKKKFEEDKKNNTVSIGFDDIANVVSNWTRIPVSKLTTSEKQKLLNLENVLHKRVVGQDDAVVAVSKAIRRARAGLKDPNRPIGTFLFIGPTGVGKTELSKALAEALFDDENHIIRLDMSEYMESHSVSKIIGSPPGYVGHEDAGQLTEQVRRKPYSVILFDEIEKAHPDIFNILLQILDDGRLTDSHGRVVNFKNTIIIMTSNAGVNENSYKQNRQIYQKVQDLEQKRKLDEEAHNILLSAIKLKFRPEFLNRIDSIVVFKTLNKMELAMVAKYLITKLSNKLSSQNIKIKLTENALKYLVEQGYNSEWGARPLRRVIEQEIEDKLADEILMGNILNGTKVIVDVENGKLSFK